MQVSLVLAAVQVTPGPLSGVVVEGPASIEDRPTTRLPSAQPAPPHTAL
jgi:hypothetical protein